ncbi:MAG: hypothetical protein JNM60_02910 [Candidatus Competibacteraceae bacterium]|nr:hypothetical protein [Candidatus Competibacteraceae bacterium]
MNKEFLDTISSIATLATPILIAFLGGIGWLIQKKLESAQTRQIAQLTRIRDLEDKLREDRISTYNALLEPFFLLFTTEAAFVTDPNYSGKNKNDLAISMMLSVEYRRIGFKLSLVADDEVVRAYNRLMQFFYHAEGNQAEIEIKTSHWIALMSTLLLEIRKSMGNKSSSLDRWEMIEWFMQEASKMKAIYENNVHNGNISY